MKFNRYKVLLFLSLLVVFYVAVYLGSGSHLEASLAVLFYILVWLVISSLLRKFKHRVIVRFLKSIGCACEPNDLSLYKSGYVSYKGVWATGSVSMAKRGVKIYFLGAGNLLIEWSMIKAGCPVVIGDTTLFALDVYNNNDSTDRILVPYHPEFTDKWVELADCKQN